MSLILKGLFFRVIWGHNTPATSLKDLASKKICHSYSRKGCPYDNACIESFHALIKKEEIYRHVYKDSKEAYDSIFEYIESWYNRKRTHSSLGYKTPAAVHAECAA